ncbi:autotransporter outer membrane beta-barrel domain-containing protein [Rahnella victoriana]|jgi:outer membrane autotransporter protein|nr:autotransporter outer membrane beta-barrel domain-containing protein [Rahnella victoriana]
MDNEPRKWKTFAFRLIKLTPLAISVSLANYALATDISDKDEFGNVTNAPIFDISGTAPFDLSAEGYLDGINATTWSEGSNVSIPAFYIHDGGTLTQSVAAPVTITTHGSFTEAMLISKGGGVNLLGPLIVNTYGESKGIIMEGAGTSFLSTNDVTVNTYNNSTPAFTVNNNATATFAGTLNINSMNNGSDGLVIQDGAMGTINKVNITTAGDFSEGIILNNINPSLHKRNDVLITGSGSAVTTHGKHTNALYAEDNGFILFSNDAVITTTGEDSRAIYSTRNGGVLMNGGSVNTEYAGSTAIESNQNSYVTLVDTDVHSAGAAISSNENSVVSVLNGTISSGNTTSGIEISHQGKVHLNQVIMENTQSDKPLVDLITSYDTPDYAFGGALSLKNSQLTGKTQGVHASEGDWAVTLDNSTLTAADAFVVAGSNASQIANLSVDASNGSIINGNLIALSADEDPIASQLTLNLLNSTWQGSAINGAALTSAPAGTINIDAQDSQWLMTGSSRIDSLNMNNASVQFSDQGDYKTLEMQTLSGNGTFFMNTSLEQDAQGNSAGDLIHVTGNASGQFGLNISTSGTAAETINDGIRVAQIDDASRHNGLFSLENSVSIGAYDYYLFEGSKEATGDNNDWYLRAEIPTPDVPVPDVPVPDVPTPDTPTPDIPVPTPDTPETYRGEIPGYIAAPYLNLYYGMRIAGTLHERMGDTEAYGKGYNNRSWARTGGEHTTFDAGRFDYDSDYWFAQFGTDLYQDELKNGTRVHAGIMATLGNQSTDTQDQVRTLAGKRADAGSVRSDAYSLGGYYTRYAQDGAYIDLVGQFTWYRNQYDSLHDAKQDSYGALLSAEAGKPYTVSTNWKIEPQGQIIYQYLNAEDFSDEISDISGVSVNQGTARAGLRLFRDQAEDKASEKFKPYLTADVLSNFSDSPDINVGGTDISTTDFSDQYWQTGAGMTAQLAPNTSVYADVKYVKGFDGDMEGYVGHIGIQGRF